MSDTFKTSPSEQTDKLWKLIGHTPLAALRYRFCGQAEAEIIVKCEQYNLTGSIKDRVVLHILQRAREEKKIVQGDLLVEASCGNTGIALAAIGKALGYRICVIMPNWVSNELGGLIKAHGAEVRLVGIDQGGFAGCSALAERIGNDKDVFLLRHLNNPLTVEAHEKTTGREIGHALLLEKIKPAAFVAATGSCGTLMGVGNYLRSLFPDIRLHALKITEAESHQIEGIGAMCSSPLIDLSSLAKPIDVNEGDVILMTQKLEDDLGMRVGDSSGANLLAAIRLQQELKGAPVVTIFPDDSKKYLRKISKFQESVLDGYLTPEITLLGFRWLSKI